MSEILIGQSYFLDFDPKLYREMKPYPPLGSMYAASYVRQAGYEVAFFDAMVADSELDWADALDEHKPTFAVLYEDNFNYLSKMCLLRMREAAITMIGMARSRGCTVIVCGSDATDHADRYLKEGADFVILGEGEATLMELLNSLSGATSAAPEHIEGVARLDANGHPVSSGRMNVMTDLDSIPFPAWDLIDVAKYRDIWKRRHGFFSLNLVTSRGCPFHCNWCAKPIWGQSYNARSPENVVSEMRLLKKRFQPDHIWFMDDMMGIKPGWLSRFADLVNEHDVVIPFKCLNRVDLLLRDGVIEALDRAGCSIVWSGVESGSQTVLDAMDKGTTVEQTIEATRRLHEAGIQVGFFLQFGYPGETRDDIRKTIQLVRDCHPDQIGVSVSYPLPGTKFYEAVKSQMGARQNWYDSDDLAMMYSGPYPTAFYRQLHRVVHKVFRRRKAWRALLDVARSPTRLRPHHAREAAVMTYHMLTEPVARMRMAFHTRPASNGIEPISGMLSPEAAATPSPN